MNMEMRKNNEEVRKSVQEGGLEEGIESMREKLIQFEKMINQIELLQRVPHGYSNLGEKVGENELPALDQFVEYRGSYDALQKKTEQALSDTYQSLLTQLQVLRDHTGVSSEEEAMKFDKDTGRQEKDN